MRMKGVVLSALFTAFMVSLTVEAQAFWWGIATAPYQTEDVAVAPDSEHYFKTDWDLFYEDGKIPEPRGNGTFSFTEVDRDIATLVELGVSHYRFGIEWARVEPKPGTYNEDAIAHYRTVIRKLKAKNITPVVCLWHFTFPDWTVNKVDASKNGWTNPLVLERWKPYVKKIAESLGADVEYYAPQNEPNANALAGYFLGRFPPGVKYKLGLFREQMSAAARAYNEAARTLKETDSDAKIISIQNLIYWEKTWWDIFGYFYALGQEYNFMHLDQVAANTDYLGFNYYYKAVASPLGETTEVYAPGLEKLILEVHSRYKKPILITENGVAEKGPELQPTFLETHVAAMRSAIAQGANVKGYFYWSLIDNFEWAHGYAEKFGLYRLSEDHKALVAKPVADLYKSIIQGTKTGEAKKAP